jgi:hypothetical protein
LRSWWAAAVCVVGGDLAGDRGRHRGEGGDLAGVLDGYLAVMLGAACWAAAVCVVGGNLAGDSGRHHDMRRHDGRGKKQAQAACHVRRSWVERLVFVRSVQISVEQILHH